MDYNLLKPRQFGEPKNHSHYWSLPVHRALCWWLKVAKAKHQVNTALTKQHTSKVIELVLSWLYRLRKNITYIIHIGATWNSNINRSQLLDGLNSLAKRVPFIIKVMMDNLRILWGEANYPLVE